MIDGQVVTEDQLDMEQEIVDFCDEEINRCCELIARKIIGKLSVRLKERLEVIE